MSDFITFSLADKISLLTQLEQRQVLGSVKSQGSGDRVATEFTGDTAHLMNQIEKLKESIRRDPDFKSNHPLYCTLMKNRPQGITRGVFGGGHTWGYGQSGY